MPVRPHTLLLSLLTLSAACSTSDRARSDTASAQPAATPATSSTSPSSTGNMAGMNGMPSDTVVDHVRRDLASMDAASGDAITPLVPSHKQTVESLIADCEMMMKGMKMTPPKKWQDAVATLRADLGSMGIANATTLHAMWPAHKQHVQAMLDMRHDMMKM